MKKILFLTVLSLIFYILDLEKTFASQFEEVNLNIYKTQELTAPKINSQVFSRINQSGEIISDEEYYDDSEYFKPESDVAESKLEKGFYNFVDNVLINNKLNNYASKVGNKYLKE